MKFSTILAAAVLTAAFAAPTLAGQPDNPGAGGQLVKESAQFAQDNGINWGQVVSDIVHTSDATLGQAIQEIKPLIGGSPNPANDNGKGND